MPFTCAGGLNFNLGDDLFIKILCERYPEHKFYLFSKKDYSNKSVFNLNNLLLEEKLKISQKDG